jgi:hypothetical protein
MQNVQFWFLLSRGVPHRDERKGQSTAISDGLPLDSPAGRPRYAAQIGMSARKAVA